MRCVQNTDDFFAPRPKLSWGVRVIRVLAFFAASLISVGFLSVLLKLIRDQKTIVNQRDFIVYFFAFACLQSLCLIPCWRAWMLRRWACIALIFLWLFLPLSLVGVSIRSLAFAILITGFLLAIIDVEKLNLKPGF